MEALIKQYTEESIALLERMIAIPSVSRNETAVADMLEQQMKEWGLEPKRYKNNILTPALSFKGEGALKDSTERFVLLNAHVDTVRPSDSWTKEPFKPTYEGDKLYGLGANDCGGGLVSLLAAYRVLLASVSRDSVALGELDSSLSLGELGENVEDNNSTISSVSPRDKTNVSPRDKTNVSPRDKINDSPRDMGIIFCASAEEEVSGKDGFEYVRQFLPPIDVAIVGEPTGMQPAIAEKGLMVIDMVSHGKSGHAARNEGVNAIYEALDDIQWIRGYQFPKVSDLLGPTKMSLTVCHAGSQHNVVPDKCEMVLDVRTNEHYTNEEVLEIIRSHCKSEVKARSTRLSSSHISEEHPLIKRLEAMGRKPFGSPTLSDQALMPWPSFKLGPGDSARSHTADEYIRRSEIEEAVRMYVGILSETATINSR